MESMNFCLFPILAFRGADSVSVLPRDWGAGGASLFNLGVLQQESSLAYRYKPQPPLSAPSAVQVMFSSLTSRGSGLCCVLYWGPQNS